MRMVEAAIKECLTKIAPRDQQKRGMDNRFNLVIATRYEWTDARDADGVPIFARIKTGSRENQKLHVPFDRMIVSNKVSYFASNIQTLFTDGVSEEVKTFYKQKFSDPMVRSLGLKMARDSTDMGTSFMLVSIDKNGELKFVKCGAYNTHVFYNPLTDEPEFAIRYFKKVMEIYDGTTVTTYSIVDDEWIAGETVPHGLGTVESPFVPIVEFRNNPEVLGNPELTLTMQDAFDTTFSDLGSELAQIRSAYLVMKGLGSDTEKIKKNMKDAGIIIIDTEGGDASFITKDLKPDAITLFRDTIRQLIFEGASSYDPAAFIEGGSPTAFEVSQRLHNMDMDCEVTIGEWRVGFERLDFGIRNFLMIYHKVPFYELSSVNRIFRKVVPRNILQSLVDAKNAGIEIDNETLLALSGLPLDPVAVSKKMESTPDGEDNKKIDDEANE